MLVLDQDYGTRLTWDWFKTLRPQRNQTNEQNLTKKPQKHPPKTAKKAQKRGKNWLKKGENWLKKGENWLKSRGKGDKPNRRMKGAIEWKIEEEKVKKGMETELRKTGITKSWEDEWNEGISECSN